MNTLNKEKRLNTRFPSSRPLLMIINNKSVYATMTDFSRHGIGFMSTEQPALNSRVEVHFDIPKAENQNQVKPLQFKAEIKHCILCSHESHIGVKIEQPSQEYLKLFDALSAA